MNKPTIEAFILCWNEERMIANTINHYSKFCDKITIIDNCSTDDTLEIIKHLNTKKGYNLSVKQFESENQIRDDKYLYLKNNIWKNSTADWVIVCDMDEILYHPNIIEQLTTAKKNGVGIIQTEGYNMVSNSFPGDYSKPITEQVKTGVRSLNFDKSIIFSPQIIKEMWYAPGAHTCNPIYKKNVIKVNHPEKFKLLHYKYMGLEYLKQRHQMYATRLSNYNKHNNFGGEYLNEKHVEECFSILSKQKLSNVI